MYVFNCERRRRRKKNPLLLGGCRASRAPSCTAQPGHSWRLQPLGWAPGMSAPLIRANTRQTREQSFSVLTVTISKLYLERSQRLEILNYHVLKAFSNTEKQHFGRARQKHKKLRNKVTSNCQEDFKMAPTARISRASKLSGRGNS